MADKKISELVSITGSATAADDYFVVVDTSGAVTYKISRAELNNAIEQDVLENISITNLTSDLNTNGNDIKFGDNDKAIFGAGSDLQIYHDGADSYITESATGSLYIGADSTIALTDAAVTQNKAQFITGGAVNLFHNNAQKFATTATGVDVTGTVTADGLTVAGDAVFEPDNDGVRITGANYATLRLEENDTTDLNTTMFNSGGKFSIFTSSDDRASGTERVTLDHSTGNVGIGTASPASNLTVTANSSGSSIVVGDFVNSSSSINGTGAKLWLSGRGDSSINRGTYIEGIINGSGSRHDLVFATSDYAAAPTEAMRITSAGKVETTGRNFGFHNHGTQVSLADDASIVINASTAGGGILAIYETASGQWAVFGVGYNGASIMSALNSANFDVIDTDGRICVISANHTITIKNRLGGTKGFFINMFMAGNSFAG